MKINLLEALAQVPDFRALRGRRYPLQLILLLVIMGTISDCLGYIGLKTWYLRKISPGYDWVMLLLICRLFVV